MWRDATRLCAPVMYGNAVAWTYQCWWNLSCPRRCCLIYVQFPWGRTTLWTDDEGRDEQCGDWRWRSAAWWHKLSDASEEFAVCIFKVEGNPEGQQFPVPFETFENLLSHSKTMVEKRALKWTHFKRSVKVYSDNLQHISTSTPTLFLLMPQLTGFLSIFYLSSSAFTLSSFSYSSCFFPYSYILFVFIFFFFFGFMSKTS